MFLCQCLFKLLWKECDSDLMQQDYSQKENEIVLFQIRCSIYTGEHNWLSATLKTERRHSLRKLHKANLARELKPSKTRFESSKEGKFLLKIHDIWHPFPLKYLGKMKVKFKLQVAQSCLTLCDPMDYTVHGILQASITAMGSLSLLQGILPTQGWNPDLLHCRWILYHLSHKGRPRMLKWVAYPFSSRSSWPRNWMQGSPALRADSLLTELSGKPLSKISQFITLCSVTFLGK